MKRTKGHILEHRQREELVVRVLEDESNHGADGRQIVAREASAPYSHLGREDIEFPWERTDKAQASKNAAGL